MMKILAPINDIKNLNSLIDAGADEFFFGFYNDEDIDRFGKYFELNRMSGFGRYANRFDYDQSINLIKEISSAKKDSFVTLNSSGYDSNALSYLEKYVDGLINAGVTGVIVSCPEMMKIVKKHGGHSVVSCVGTVYNSATVRFYQKLGAMRIIVPRDLSMEEISKLKEEVPEMEYETFIMRNGCILSDGNCLGIHQFEHGGICLDVKRSSKEYISNDPFFREKMSKTQDIYDTCLYKHACAVCAIYRMIKAGITACKMVGRVDRPNQVLEDMQLVNENRKIAMKCSSEKEYFENMILPKDTDTICANGYSCYFPEISNPRVRV